MNIAPLKKSLFKESIIFSLILLVVAGVLFFVSTLHNDYEQEKAKEGTASLQVLSEKQTLETKYAKLLANMDVLAQLNQRIATTGLFLDGEALKFVLGKYQDQLLLSKLSVNAGMIEGIKENPQYTRQNFVATKSSVTIAIDALSDEDVYQLLRGMHQELPGFVKVTSIKLSKKGEVSKDVIDKIQKSGAHPLIVGELSFDWYGLKSTKEDDPFNAYKRNAQ